MKRTLSLLLTLAEKDVRIELRSKESLYATFLFVALILILFSRGFGQNPAVIQKVAPGLIWVVIAFSGTIATSHLSDRSETDQVHEGLRMTGVSSTVVFFSKFITALLFLLGIELVTIPLFMIFFNYGVGDWLVLFSTVLALGSIGYAAVTTLFSALLCRERLKILYPVTLYPVLLPLLFATISATSSAMAGDFPKEIPFLIGYDIIFLTASTILYEFIVEEPS